VSQTKHRTVRVDSNSNLDEVEQVMNVKAHRAFKKAVKNEYDLDEEFSDSGYEDLIPEVEYLLRKSR
jgi:hypothetical protein